MRKEQEYKISAQKLSGRGPRMMVERAMESQKLTILRVIVTEEAAVEDLTEYFRSLDVDYVVDKIGDEHHFLVDFTTEK